MRLRASLRPDFLIVGSERSGTTLVQRLAAGLPGVRVPPETHFFPFYRRMLVSSPDSFPMGGVALREALDAYLASPFGRGLALDAGEVIDDLGGRCASVLELFDACVRLLAGDAEVYGEKTPRHLGWWRPLSRARSDLRFIGVVRDPRGVVASALSVPWGSDDPLNLAERWRHDQRLVQAARDQLPSDRLLIVRYEDVVVDPDDARGRIARFLGVGAGGNAGTEAPSADQLYHDWEHWKSRTNGAITRDRIRAWEETLSPAACSTVTAVCHAGMRAFGYGLDAPGPLQVAARNVAISPRRQLERLHRRRGANSMQRALDGADLEAAGAIREARR